MNTKILYFLGGVVVGSAATFFALRANMEARIDEEVENVRQAFQSAKVAQNANLGPSEANLNNVSEKDDKDDDENANLARKLAAENAQRKADLITSSNISSSQGYVIQQEQNTHAVSYNLFSKPPQAKDIHNGQDEGEDLDVIVEPKEKAQRPYVIMPDQFVNEHTEFDKTTLMYYSDDVLVEEMTREIITDIDSAIGTESLNHFGEFEDDVVYVRNEKISTDYEIIYNDVPFVNLYDDR